VRLEWVLRDDGSLGCALLFQYRCDFVELEFDWGFIWINKKRGLWVFGSLFMVLRGGHLGGWIIAVLEKQKASKLYL